MIRFRPSPQNPQPIRPSKVQHARRRRAEASDRSDHVIIYYASVTRWNSKAMEYLSADSCMAKAAAVCIAEHHLQHRRLTQEVRALDKMGWKTAAVGAVATPESTRDGPGHGGVAVLVQKRLHSVPLTPDVKLALQAEEHRGTPTQWSATTLRFESMEVLIVVVYLAPEYGIQGSNWTTPREIASFVHGRGLPYLIIGDFNNVIEELLPTGLDKCLQGVWVQPEGEVPGGHRPIDLILTNVFMAPLLEVQWDLDGPWAQPHTGFVVRLPRAALRLRMRVLESPISYNMAMGPDLPWEWHVARAETMVEEGLARVRAAGESHLGSDPTLDREYIIFCMAAESVMLSRQAVSYNAARTHRGWPMTTQEVPLAAPTPVGWRCKPTGLTLWCAMRARLDNYIGVIRKKRAELFPEHREALRAQLARVQRTESILPSGEAEADVIRRIQAICEGAWALESLEVVSRELRATIRKQECHLAAAGRRGYQQWIRESLNSGGGALHRMSLSWGRPLEALAMERDDMGQPLVHPMDIISSKAKRWATLWKASAAPVSPDWLEPLRRQAALQELEALDEDQLEAGLRCFKARIGLGVDQQNPRWWRGLPQGALGALLAVLQRAERVLAWPTPLQLNLAQLIFKDEAADRPITLTQGLYRLWTRCRRKDVAAWSAERAGHWDRAVAGSAPLRAALLRQVRLEMATAQGFSWIELLWDLTKFYAFVSLDAVARIGVQQDYPLVCLVLGLQMAAAPRRIRAEQSISDVIFPTRSLAAGCGQAVDYSRLALWEVLEDLHLRYRPLQLSSWVDDLGHQEVGHERVATTRAISVAVDLVRGLRSQGFVMSSKSLLLASTRRTGLKVQAALREADIEVQLVQTARDLGVDGHARRRSTVVMQGRLKKAGIKSRVIQHVVKLDRQARILCRTGFRPTLWGLEAQGLAPSTLKRLRGQVAGMSSCRYPGGCTLLP